MDDPRVTLEPMDHWNTAKPAAKAFRVLLDGVEIGRVEHTWPTMERKPRGSRIVTSRWTRRRPAWSWDSAKPGIRSAGYWRETRKDAVASVVQAWERED